MAPPTQVITYKAAPTLLAVAALIAVTAAGCGGSNSSDTPADPYSAFTPGHAAKNGTASPRRPHPKSGGGLTKFGATVAAWNATHQQAPGYDKGSVFGPMVTHDGEPAATYAAVNEMGGKVVADYTLNLPDGTDFEAAQQIVMAEMPADAKVVQTTDPAPDCRYEAISSPAVMKAVKVDGYDHTWRIVAEFLTAGGSKPFSTGSVDNVILTLMQGKPTC